MLCNHPKPKFVATETLFYHIRTALMVEELRKDAKIARFVVPGVDNWILKTILNVK
jgi:hypothetical protein